MRFLMIYPNSTGNTKVPLGILYINTLLQREGHDVQVFDMTRYGVELEKHDINIRGKFLNFQPIDLEPYGVTYSRSTMDEVEHDLEKTLETFRPDLIGVSITEDTSMMGLRLAEVAKRILPGIRTIFGGVFCITMPDFVISRNEVDLVCVGEGEEAIVELLRRIGRDEEIDSIKGIWVKNPDGAVIKNEVAPPTDLNSLPFPDLNWVDDCHLYSPMAGHVYKMTFVESQRGCPRRCTYCCNQIFLDAYTKYRNSYLRRKSVPRLIRELAYLKDTFKINFFQFTDDDFLLRPTEELKLFTEIYKREIDLPFWIQAEAWNATHTKVSLVREAGCIAISMGIETGSDFIREEVYKRKTPKEITRRAFKIMHEHGIRTSGNVIIGVPHEGRKEIFETIELVRECEPCSLNINIFAPYLGTALRDYCVKMGYLDDNFLREGRVSWKAVLNMPQITRDEIEGLMRTFALYSTLPSEYYSDIEKCEQFTEESTRILSRLEEIYWDIMLKRGMNVDVPGFNYDKFLVERKAELAAKESNRG
jgi:anaerobic magnesium-protoporphyrin IX monomethyl ester cyclase